MSFIALYKDFSILSTRNFRQQGLRRQCAYSVQGRCQLFPVTVRLGLLRQGGGQAQWQPSPSRLAAGVEGVENGIVQRQVRPGGEEDQGVRPVQLVRGRVQQQGDAVLPPEAPGEILPAGPDGALDYSVLPKLVRPETTAVVCTHASNLTGSLVDLEQMAAAAKAYGLLLIVDAAQTAGHWEIDFDGWGLSALSVPGHKGLMGPSGTGALLLSPAFARELRPIVTGGTGSASDLETQPLYMPDRFESGTPNLPGLYGLEAAVSFVLRTGTEALRAHEAALTARLLDQLREVPRIRLAGPWELEDRVGVVSVDFLEADNASAAFRLEEEHGILTRCGLHCAPAAHRTLGTFPQGTVRFSPGWFTTAEEIDAAAAAVAEIACGGAS